MVRFPPPKSHDTFCPPLCEFPRNLFPLTAFKNAPNPKFVQNLSQRLFLGGFQSGGQKFVKNCQNLSENYDFSNFNNFFTNFRPPDWNPQKQSLGQILDKFGARGVFESCMGKKVSQSNVLVFELQM